MPFLPKIRTFRSVRFDGDWEIDFVWTRLNIRIGRSQCAIWWNYEPIAMWFSKKARQGLPAGRKS